MERGGDCPLCQMSFDTTRQLDAHTSSAHQNAWSCTAPGCGKAFSRRKQLRRHEVRHNPIYNCNDCDKTFGVFYDFQQHRAFHQLQEKGRSSFTCSKCNTPLSTAKALRKHNTTCQVFCQRVCLISDCNSVLRNWGSLLQHWRAMHPATPEDQRRFKLLAQTPSPSRPPVRSDSPEF